MENAGYGVWLQLVLGQGSHKAPMLIDYFGSCRDVYESDNIERRLCGLLTYEEMDKMESTSLDEAYEILEACRRLNYKVITPDLADYPARLRNISNYPMAIYISGELPDIDNEVCIGMVGTRRASKYGYNSALSIAKDLSACGACVVSGGARGIDTAAHQGALIGGSNTICVLGCGINTRYNMDNDGLRKVIAASGAVVSEYPPGAPPLSYHFPTRNRIISALSLGIVVVEAGNKSGSLITANMALEQGKDLYAVPGEISSYQAKGTNRLIVEGAKPVTCADDVLEEYVIQYPHKIRLMNGKDGKARVFDNTVRPKWERNSPPKSKESAEHKKVERTAKIPTIEMSEKKPVIAAENPTVDMTVREETAVGLSENAAKVYRALTATPKLMQELIDELCIDASVFMQSVTELEIYGKVETLPGKRYVRR